MQPDTPILVLGHQGLLGSAFLRRLEADGFTAVSIRSRAACDLRDQAATRRLLDEVRPEVVFLAAGVVGGILRNRDFPATMIEDNLQLQTNVLAAARAAGVGRLVFFGSSCMYPRECPQPMAEDALLTGRPEPTSLPYSVAKLAGTQLCLAYNRQDGGRRFLPVIPNTMYGPGDDFDPETGHVLPALIRRMHDARRTGAARLTLWGSGAPRREFVYVDDVVDAVLHLLAGPADSIELPVNLGCGVDHSIRELAETIAGVVGYQGELDWDRSKPDGAPRKLLDSSRLAATGWRPRVDLEEGVRRTYAWFLEGLAGDDQESPKSA